MKLWLAKLLHKEHQFIRVVQYNSNKTTTVKYLSLNEFKELENKILINPNHFYKTAKFNTILITDQSAQSIDPMDFKSAYDRKSFETAMETKLIKDTFATISKEKLSREIVLIVLNIVLSLGILYLLVK